MVGDLDNPSLGRTLIDLEPDLILTSQMKPELLALLRIAPVVTGLAGGPGKPCSGPAAPTR